MQYLNFSTLANRHLRDLAKTTETYKTFYKYTKAEILSYLQAPDRNERQLRDASIYLYNACSYYKRLIEYFAKMPTFTYIMTPSKFDEQKVNLKSFRKAYLNNLHALETMQISDTFRAPVLISLREDVSYNYVWETKDSFMLQALDSEYCKLSSISDGCYNMAFDFRYFDSRPDDLILYADEFQQKYEAYKKGEPRWQELDPKRTFVLKANYDLPYIIPPFAGVFESIYDIIDYKALMLAKTETGNYKILVMKVPTDDHGNLTIPLATLTEFYQQMGQNLPENIGIGMSPTEITSFDFEKAGTNDDSDRVKAAEQAFWSAGGVSSLNFNNEKASNNALLQSIKSDETIIWGLVSQIERWLNRYLKFRSGSQKFHVVMPQITVYNRKEMAEEYFRGAQYGLPTKTLYAATAGLKQSDLMGVNYIENEVLQLQDKFIPLSSSHTQSGSSNTGGRPTNESKGKELTEDGETTQEYK